MEEGDKMRIILSLLILTLLITYLVVIPLFKHIKRITKSETKRIDDIFNDKK